MTDPKKREASIKEIGEELPQEQWERFEAAVDAAVKGGPKHRVAASRNDDQAKEGDKPKHRR